MVEVKGGRGIFDVWFDRICWCGLVVFAAFSMIGFASFAWFYVVRGVVEQQSFYFGLTAVFLGVVTWLLLTWRPGQSR